MATVKERAKKSLKRRHMTQHQLAAQLGISPAYLSLILSGQRRAPVAIAFAIQDAIGVPAREFVQVA